MAWPGFLKACISPLKNSLPSTSATPVLRSDIPESQCAARVRLGKTVLRLTRWLQKLDALLRSRQKFVLLRLDTLLKSASGKNNNVVSAGVVRTSQISDSRPCGYFLALVSQIPNS
jgi:hypothetical protein